MEASRYGSRLSALVGLVGSAFPLSFSKTQVLIDQLLGVEYSFGEVCVYSRGAIATIRERISATLEQPMQEALPPLPVSSWWLTLMKPAPPATGNADGNNPTGKWGWQRAMVPVVVTVFIQVLSGRRLPPSSCWAAPLAGSW